MADESSRIPDAEWEVVVANVPVVSVDLVVKHDGGLLLGRRENEPAKGEWFVPGGTVLKNEQLTEAVQRVATTELGCDVRIRDELGAFEHFYDTSDVEGVESKHYVAHGFVVEATGAITPDDQHAEFRVFEPPFAELHPYVARYAERVEWP